MEVPYLGDVLEVVCAIFGRLSAELSSSLKLVRCLAVVDDVVAIAAFAAIGAGGSGVVLGFAAEAASG